MKKIFSYFIYSLITLVATVATTESFNYVSKNLKPSVITYTKTNYEFPTFTIVNNKEVSVEKVYRERVFKKEKTKAVTFKKVNKVVKLSTARIKRKKLVSKLSKLKIKNKVVHKLSTRFEIVDNRNLNVEIKTIDVNKLTKLAIANFEKLNLEHKKLIAINRKKDLKPKKEIIEKEIVENKVEVAKNTLIDKKPVVDSVSIQNSGNLKDEKETFEDDLVVFDYSKPKKVNKKKEELEAKEPIKDVFKKVKGLATTNLAAGTNYKADPIKQNPLFDFERVKRETSSDNKAIKNAIAAITDNKKSDYSNMATKSKQPVVKMIKSSLVSDVTTHKTFKSKLYIKANSIKINGKKSSSIKNFEITYLDDYSAINQDFGSGKIVLNNKLSSKYAIREAYLKDYSLENFVTRTELVFEGDKIALNLPLINKESIYSLVEENNYYDSHTLVELDNKTEDVELDKIKNKNSYFKKFYLDNNFQVVDPEASEYSYVLFLGVVPGNRIISYKLNNGRETSKIYFVDEEELYFDSNFYHEGIVDEFEVSQIDLLGNEAFSKEYQAEDIVFMLNDTISTKESLNEHKFTNLLYPFNSRRYYVVKGSKDNIYIGKLDQKRVKVPTEEYISEIIARFNVDNLAGQCIVQINLSKPAKEIKYDGVQPKYNINLDSFVVDKSGQSFDTVDVNTKLVFIKGEVGSQNGIISVKVKYFDNSVDYLKTYCSNNSYLVEQL